jgi:hypothetical protein
MGSCAVAIFLCPKHWLLPCHNHLFPPSNHTSTCSINIVLLCLVANLPPCHKPWILLGSKHIHNLPSIQCYYILCTQFCMRMRRGLNCCSEPNPKIMRDLRMLEANHVCPIHPLSLSKPRISLSGFWHQLISRQNQVFFVWYTVCPARLHILLVFS